MRLQVDVDDIRRLLVLNENEGLHWYVPAAATGAAAGAGAAGASSKELSSLLASIMRGKHFLTSSSSKALLPRLASIRTTASAYRWEDRESMSCGQKHDNKILCVIDEATFLLASVRTHTAESHTRMHILIRKHDSNSAYLAQTGVSAIPWLLAED
jgi:hypothetical protein